MLLDDEADAVEESSEPGICRPLVVDKLDFDRFHWSDSEDSFADSRTETGQQSTLRVQFPIRIDELFLHSFKRSESHSRFWNGAVY